MTLDFFLAPFKSLLKDFFDDFEWIHISLGITGNLLFFIGSFFFLSEKLMPLGTWLFIIGSLLMLIGAIGQGLVRYVYHERREKKGKEGP